MHPPCCQSCHHRVGFTPSRIHQFISGGLLWHSVHFALAMPLTLLDIMPLLVSVGVMFWHDTTPFVMFWLKHAIGSSWKQAMTSWPTIATPILLTTGLQARQLLLCSLMESGVSARYAALATEGRKYRANDAK